VLSLSPVTEAVIFFAAMVTLTSAILAAIYFLLRDPQPHCYVVRDANGQQIAYIYYESEPGRRSAAKLLTKDERGRAEIFLMNRL